MSEVQAELQKINRVRKSNRKMLVLLRTEGEDGLRKLAEDIPFLELVDPLPEPSEMINILVERQKKLDEDYQIKATYAARGSKGLKDLYKKVKQDLLDKGIDPES